MLCAVRPTRSLHWSRIAYLLAFPPFLSLTAPRPTTALHISCSLVPATAATVVVQAQAQAVAVWVVLTLAPEARVASAAQVPHQEWASA